MEKGKGRPWSVLDDLKNINILLYGVHHINALIWDGDHPASRHGTFVYGESHTHDRQLMWELLKRSRH
jgi:hypothetical protein